MSKVTILHPDLGLGGAERLIVDVALALQHKDYSVNIVTSHHDPTHCFQETKNGDLKVTVVGDWIPRHIGGLCHALMAYLRMMYAAFYIVFLSNLQPDVIICDSVSVAIPILKWKCPVIYYCHHPDQLLAQKGGRLKQIYRAPLNWWEESTTAKASHIFVNSKYTLGVFKETFKTITNEPEVLYPSLHSDPFDLSVTEPIHLILPKLLGKDSVMFLSINRYERKKNLKLALEALSQLREMLTDETWDKVHLVMAGGYDPRVLENVEHFLELVKLSTELKLEEKVTFLKSPKDEEKLSLLRSCNCLIYTPTNEHFGIVPLEAMYVGKPVIASNSGGPMETILHGKTGFLCDSVADFVTSMHYIVENDVSGSMAQAAVHRVTSMFSFKKFSNQLDEAVKKLCLSRS